MAGKKAAKRGRQAAKRPRKASILDRLSPDESDSVLKTILAIHPELVGEAESAAKELLEGLSFESIADDVEYEFNSLDLDEVLEGAGRSASGYVEPTEAAWENLAGPSVLSYKMNVTNSAVSASRQCGIFR